MTKNKIVLVTGGSKGIGRACINDFLNEGYIAIDASRSEVLVENVNYRYFKTDVSDEADVKALFDYSKNEFGRLDVLINNAGFGRFANLAESKTEDFDEMFAVNVRGLYLCSRYALGLMIPQNSGCIINISSIAGKNSIATSSIYCGTKHAVMGISRSMMLEVRKFNIRVVAICPGSVDTEFFNQEGTVLASTRESILSPHDVSKTCLLAVNLPVRALMNEVEIRPANPKSKN